MKRRIAVVSLISILSIAVCGCNQPASSSSSAAPAASSAPAASAAAPSQATDTDWPKATIEVVNPSAAGGETDIYGRIFNRFMEKELGQPVVTLNMAGGGGTLATNEVVNSNADGYRVLVFHNGFLVNYLMDLTDENVDTMKIAAIPVIDGTQCFFVPADAPYSDLKEMIEYIKAGNQVNCATEVGSFTHFWFLSLEQAADVKFDLVDAGTTPEKIAAMLAGNVDIMGANYSVMKDYVENGDLKIICVLSDERNPAFSDVPTAKELGYNVVVTKFFFYAFPGGTDPAIVKKFNDAAIKVGNDTEFIAEIAALYGDASAMNVEEATAYMKNLQESYAALVS